MSDHGIENQPNEWLVTKIKQLESDIREMRTLQLQGQNAINMGVISGFTSFTVPATSTYSNSITIASVDSTKVLMGQLLWTLYNGSVALGNEISYGNAVDSVMRWSVQCDWGAASPDHHDVPIRYEVINGDTVPYTLDFDWEFRYVVNEAH